jgi:multidrug efflux pump subunit AcrA (membrane-fusion protein)
MFGIATARTRLKCCCVCLALIASLAAIPSRAETASVPLSLENTAIDAAGIMTERVTRGAAEAEVTLPGVVTIPQKQRHAVSAPAEGLIEAMYVATDEQVSVGQPIARLRSPEVIEAQRQFLTAIDDLRLAEDRFRRAEALVATQTVSEREFREAQNAASQARARLDERTYLLGLMEMSPEDVETLRKTRRLFSTVTIRAPRGGTIVTRHTSAGERVATAAPLYTIADLNPVWINIQVPSFRLTGIAEGVPVTVQSHGVSGRVLRVGRTVDQTTQAAQVVAEVGTNGGSVRPGLAVMATIRIPTGASDS